MSYPHDFSSQERLDSYFSCLKNINLRSLVALGSFNYVPRTHTEDTLKWHQVAAIIHIPFHYGYTDNDRVYLDRAIVLKAPKGILSLNVLHLRFSVRDPLIQIMGNRINEFSYQLLTSSFLVRGINNRPAVKIKDSPIPNLKIGPINPFEISLSYH